MALAKLSDPATTVRNPVQRHDQNHSEATGIVERLRMQRGREGERERERDRLGVRVSPSRKGGLVPSQVWRQLGTEAERKIIVSPFPGGRRHSAPTPAVE